MEGAAGALKLILSGFTKLGKCSLMVSIFYIS